ncbi:hypothetical protein SCUCBS95973_002219 [Sporothrix curviconia]|uniref:Uncharacterized protein n=1 Tax=Sporothrix curviconia TaxID=1260050 RepID=A0ABP0B576_9PEZI
MNQTGNRRTSHLTPLDTQREVADHEHDQDVTHIIAAEAEFASLFQTSEADTIIWLHAPAASISAPKMTCTGVVYPNQWVLRYSSAVLRHSGFEKFPQLLDNERYQTRKASELLLSGLLGPDAPIIMRKVRYVIDLGPSTDFDLRSEHLEALTLPKGIIQYSMMTRIEPSNRAPISAAGGHDDACQCFSLKLWGGQCNEPGYWINNTRPLQAQPTDIPDSSHPSDSTQAAGTAVEGDRDTVSTTADDETAVGTSSTDDATDSVPAAPEFFHVPADPASFKDGTLSGSIWDLTLTPEFRIDDYCEIRHIANVIRLLLAMAGRPLLLNSAARVYTIAGLAKLFRLTSSDVYDINAIQIQSHSNAFGDRLRSIFSDWFFVRNNTNIIDVLPEESFIIAWNIKLPVVARVAYRILVAERALQEAGATDAQPRKYQSRQKTVFGRELSGLLDEDMETMLDHASEALVQRVLKYRDAHLSHVDQLTGGVGTGQSASGDSDAVPYPALEYCAKLRSPWITIRQLLETARILTDSAEMEKALVGDGDGQGNIFWPGNQFPVADALAAVRHLLDKLEQAVIDSLPRGLPDSELLLTTYTDSVQQSLGFYVRDTTLHKNWFVYVYNELPFDKKCMTAVYWRLLGQSGKDKLAGCLKQVQLTQLVATVNSALHAALIFDVPMRDYERRDRLRENLIDRLNTINMGLQYSTIVSRASIDFFSAENIPYCLYNLAERSHKSFYQMGLFVPEFELSMVKPSPHLLLGLSVEELRFLPLWAGGDNDGTGAVYEPDLPTAHLGPITPGPEYHTGTTNTSMSTPSFDGASSMNGPPSISDSGDMERFTDIAMSDAGTERLGANDNAGNNGVDDDDQRSVSSSFILVRNLDGLNIAASERSTGGSSIAALTATTSSTGNSVPSNVSRVVNDGHSMLTGASRASIATPSSSSAVSSTFGDMVVIPAAGSDTSSQRPASFTGSPPLAATTSMEFEFEYDEDEDGIYNYDDDDDDDDDNDENDQEFYDDDNADARSDDTVMPDRDEIEQDMRLDAATAATDIAAEKTEAAKMADARKRE